MTSKTGIRKGGMFSVLAGNCQPAIKVKAGRFDGIVAISKVPKSLIFIFAVWIR